MGNCNLGRLEYSNSSISESYVIFGIDRNNDLPRNYNGNYDIEYKLGNIIHRTGAPAGICVNALNWIVDDNLHRTDGAAYITNNECIYYINGKNISCENFMKLKIKN